MDGDLFDDVFGNSNQAEQNISAGKHEEDTDTLRKKTIREMTMDINKTELAVTPAVETEEQDKRDEMALNALIGGTSAEDDDPTDIIFLVLDFLEGPFKGERFEIGKEGVSVSRKGITPNHSRPMKELHLPDPDVSRRHAGITFEKGQYWIQDVGSLNGTFIDGNRLSKERKASDKHVLKGGELLQLGGSKVKIQFRVVLIEEMVEEQKQSIMRLKRKKDRFARQLQKRLRLAAVPKPVAQEAGQIPVRRVKMESLSYREFQHLSRVLEGQQGAGLGLSGLSSAASTARLLPNTHMLLSLVEDVRMHNDKLRAEGGQRAADEERREKLRAAESRRRISLTARENREFFDDSSMQSYEDDEGASVAKSKRASAGNLEETIPSLLSTSTEARVPMPMASHNVGGNAEATTIHARYEPPPLPPNEAPPPLPEDSPAPPPGNEGLTVYSPLPIPRPPVPPSSWR